MRILLVTTFLMVTTFAFSQEGPMASILGKTGKNIELTRAEASSITQIDVEPNDYNVEQYTFSFARGNTLVEMEIYSNKFSTKIIDALSTEKTNKYYIEKIVVKREGDEQGITLEPLILRVSDE